MRLLSRCILGLVVGLGDEHQWVGIRFRQQRMREQSSLLQGKSMRSHRFEKWPVHLLSPSMILVDVQRVHHPIQERYWSCLRLRLAHCGGLGFRQKQRLPNRLRQSVQKIIRSKKFNAKFKKKTYKEFHVECGFSWIRKLTDDENTIVEAFYTNF